MNNIYDYLDYREFVSDRVDHIRDTNPNFSYRYFNKKSGFKSPNHLKQIIDGGKNLGRKGMYGICKGLGLSEKEARFFESLVHFNQAKNFEDKEKHYNELIGRYPAKHPKFLESKFYKIFTHWYYVAILELIRLENFKENAHWISRMLKPNVPVIMVRAAFGDLIEMGLIVRNESGKLERTEKMIATPEAIRDIAVKRFKHQLCNLAQASIEKDRHFDKENATLTMALSEETFKKIKKKMQDFKDEIRTLVEECESENRTSVAHMNLQMFKLTNGGI